MSRFFHFQARPISNCAHITKSFKTSSHTQHKTSSGKKNYMKSKSDYQQPYLLKASILHAKAYKLQEWNLHHFEQHKRLRAMTLITSNGGSGLRSPLDSA